MRIGIFGGTFDPIHYAHLRCAEEARESCALDRVLFIPAADPPHKAPGNCLPFHHRLAMVEAAVADHPAFFASDLEARRSGKSYSVDTLEILQRSYPGADLYFIVGLDSFRDLPTWWEYERLFSLANLVVTRRPGVEFDALTCLLPVAIQTQFCYDGAKNALRHTSGKAVVMLEETYLDISSTYIRQTLCNGRSVRYLLPAAVGAYIEQHGLYRGQERQ